MSKSKEGTEVSRVKGVNVREDGKERREGEGERARTERMSWRRWELRGKGEFQVEESRE